MTNEALKRKRKAKAKKKAKSFPMLKNNPTDNLYRAVVRYIESKGGSLVIVGGIEIQRWPGEGTHKFKVAVKCGGRAPDYEKKA